MNNKNLPIVIGIALPVIFIIAIFFVVSIPKNNASSQYSFIYAYESMDPYYHEYKNTYEIVNNKIVTKALPEPKKDSYYDRPAVRDYPILYIYDVKTDSSKEISLSDAQKYNIEPGPSSPDGYTVGYVYGHSGIFDEILLGGNRRNDGYYMTKDSSQKKVNIAGPYSYYSGNFRIIGWIK
jgi:hypothetical protein